MAYLLAVALREELRARRFQTIITLALNELEADGVESLVVRGAALAFTAYESPAHRHCHDLDLLVSRDKLASGVDALIRAGFRERSDSWGSSRGDVVLEHESGLPVALHSQPFSVAFYDGESTAFDGRTVVADGLQMRIPAPEWTLVHVIGHACCNAGRRDLRWVADSWHIVAAHDELEWDKVLATISEYRLDVAASVLLGYLAESIVDIPPLAVALANDRAERADRVAQDFAIKMAGAAMNGHIVKVWRSSDTWRMRLRLLRWYLLPTKEFMRSVVRPHHDSLTPLFYVYRPLRSLFFRLARFAR